MKRTSDSFHRASPLPSLLSMDTTEIEAWLSSLGEPRYRGRQVAHWIYQKDAHSFDEMTELPAALRNRLESLARIGRSEIQRHVSSKDGVVKYLLKLHDDEFIETVYLPSTDRASVCVSTQIGCPVGCPFCATGLSGFRRNLTAGEIVDQVLTCQVHRRISHVVFMGMGEPLLNYVEVVKAIHLMNHEMGIASRHITLSTVGIIPGIQRLAQEKLQINLAISLHAPEDHLRQKLVPWASRYPLTDLMEACRDYYELTGRKLTFEYVLLQGINDSLAQARQLVLLLRGLNCSINLIPYNPTHEQDRFTRPAQATISAFRSLLEHRGLTVTQRKERGSDLKAACGQLRGQFTTETRST